MYVLFLGDERAQAIVQELYNQAENDDDAGSELRSMLGK